MAKLWLESIKSEVKQSTHSRRQGCVKQITPFFKDVPVKSIRPPLIENWKIARGAKMAPRTFNKELETLNHILRYARDVMGLLLDNPSEKIRIRKATTPAIQIPTKEQFCILLEALRTEPQAMRSRALDSTEFLAYSGLRVAEGTAVTPNDANFSKATLAVTGAKLAPKITRQE